MNKLILILLLSSTQALANGSVHHNDTTTNKGSNQQQDQSQLSSVNSLIDFGDSTYSADYKEAAAGVNVDGGSCHGSLGIGTRDFTISGAGPSQFCQLMDSAKLDLNTAAAMKCTAPHEINKSGDAWIPNDCMKEQHRLYKRGMDTLSRASNIANRKPGVLKRVVIFLWD